MCMKLTVSAVHLGMYVKRECPNSWLFSLIGSGVAACSLYQVGKDILSVVVVTGAILFGSADGRTK